MSKGFRESMEEAGVEVVGTFDVKRFYETLAMILSRKENLSITVRVYEKKDEEKK